MSLNIDKTMAAFNCHVYIGGQSSWNTKWEDTLVQKNRLYKIKIVFNIICLRLPCLQTELGNGSVWAHSFNKLINFVLTLQIV